MLQPKQQIQLSNLFQDKSLISIIIKAIKNRIMLVRFIQCIFLIKSDLGLFGSGFRI